MQARHLKNWCTCWSSGEPAVCGHLHYLLPHKQCMGGTFQQHPRWHLGCCCV